MWATHDRAHVVNGQQDAYESWQINQSVHLQAAPGFVKRTVLRSQVDSALYFCQTFWQSEDMANAFAWAGRTDAALRTTFPRASLAEPALHEACEIVFDELAAPGVVADARDPWTFHATVHVQPGGQVVYERWKVEEGIGQRSARGFIKRTLLRSLADPTFYYYQSFWEAESFSHAYSASSAFTSVFGQLNPADVFAVPMVRQDCTIVCDQAAADVHGT